MPWRFSRIIPSPNTDTLGDGLDYRGFTFAAPAPAKLDTFILKLDYKLTQSGNQSLFVKGHLQNFHNSTAPQFPGQPPNDLLQTIAKEYLWIYDVVHAYVW